MTGTTSVTSTTTDKTSTTRSVGLRRALVIGVAISAALAGVVATVAVVPPIAPAQAEVDTAALADPNAYPERGFGQVKGLQPDFWPDIPELTPGMSTASFNFHWASWEPAVQAPPCTADQQEHDGRCFNVPAIVDDQVKAYTDAGVAVAAIVYGTPSWARGDRPCVPVAPGFEFFCVPDDPADYARFAGMVAERYDGAHGHGRVTDFVIQNEVNMNQWFNVGCGAGTPCDLDSWVADYAALYNAGYDRIRAAQPKARVLFSFTHHFMTDLDDPAAEHPAWSIQSFVPRLVPLVGDREWSIAQHPYPHNLAGRLDARDLPYATLGNTGVLVGWLRATFPNDPHAWEVQFTEQGLHNPGSLDAEQRDGLCQAFRNVLATPGVTSFIYHRLSDHPDEFGLKLGLRREDGTAKPAFDLWRHATDPGAESCGFERNGRTLVRHGYDPSSGGQWFSSRDLPAGYVDQGSVWSLAYAQEPGTALLLECGRLVSSYLSLDPTCGGDTPLGPVGWIATGAGAGLTALRSCATGLDVVATVASACAPSETASVLGYVAATEEPARTDPPPTTVAPTIPTVQPRFTA